MADPQNSHFFGTQARILMTEWQALAKIIVAHSIAAKDKPITNFEDLESFDIENLENITFATADDLPNILAQKSITIALQGPFGSMIKEKMTAYAKLSRLRLELHLSKEELFKQKRLPVAEEEKIPAKKLEKLNPAQLDEIQNELDELTKLHEQEWQQFIQEWQDRLLAYLAKSKIVITDRETKELKDEDVSSELLPRFIEVGLKLPQKDYDNMSFTDYLYLKALLTVQSALSRQHLTHSDTEIQQKLQDFKPELDKMQKQENQLLEAQKKLTQTILAPID
jgi:hypothetical protein